MSAHASLPAATGPVPEPVRVELAMAEIGRRILGEDNRATGHPIYLVEQRERIYGLTADYTERGAQGERMARRIRSFEGAATRRKNQAKQQRAERLALEGDRNG